MLALENGSSASLSHMCCFRVSVTKSRHVGISKPRSRGGEAATFLRRALMFQAELRGKRYPNASTLAELSRCSRSTAMRTIDRLRYEFGVPIEYDETNRGYYLTRSDFVAPTLPLSREELFALSLLQQMSLFVDGDTLHSAAAALWARVASDRCDVDRDVESIKGRFSLDPATVARLDGVDLMQLLLVCHQRQLVKVFYCSPWVVSGGCEYVGLLERVHCLAGLLYVLFVAHDGARIVLNASFITKVEEMHEPLRDHECDAVVPSADEEWYSGVGMWSGADLEMIEVTIEAPAAGFYRAQVWHSEQEDIWDGTKLVRRFPGVMSAELARRILGLGRALVSVKPDWLAETIREDVIKLMRICGVVR